MKLKHLLFLFLLQNTVNAQIFTDSNLPIVIITTDNDPNTGFPIEIPDEPKVLGSMKIIYRPDGTRNYLTDINNPAYINYDGRIGIENRGSTSQDLYKKPYGFTTLQNNNTTNNNVSLLNMPAENDWILNALAYDSSLIRDYISYEMYRNIGNYSPRAKYCEVIVNGDYKGLYMLMEKIKVDSNRVNIVKMTTTDITLPNLSGGYITKCDKNTGGDPTAWSYPTHVFDFVNFIHESPSHEDITLQQNEYINNEFDSLESIMNNQNASINTGYPSKIDVPTFVDFMIMNELASNVDGYQLSTYFHKDRNGKLRAGPIWDFNLTYGLDVFGERSLTNVWQFDNGDNVGASFWKNLYSNPVYKCYLSRRWNELTQTNNILNLNSIFNQIDNLVILLSESRVRENTRWNTIFNYEDNIVSLKLWLETRFNWLNSNLSNVSDCNFPSLPPIVISKIHYNPSNSGSNLSNNLEFIELTNNSSNNVDLTGFYFRELGISYVFPENSIINANNKIYLASNSTTFSQFYGNSPFGIYTRNLSNKSQKLTLADPFGNVVDNVEYQDTTPWPTSPDGTGPYLSLINVNLDNSLASSWVASSLPLEVNKNNYEDEFKVYPNPSQQLLNVVNTDLRIKSYEVFDLLGRKILNNKSSSKIIEIKTDVLARNNYLLKINLENGKSIYRKFIKN